MKPRSLDPDASVGSAVIRVNQLLRTKRPSASDLAQAAAALFESPSHVAAVPLLLRLSRHASVSVRVGAVHGMRAHPLPSITKRLVELERDASSEVRDAVKVTEDALDALPVLCAQCYHSPAAISADPSSDPFEPIDTLVHPIFCDQNCATEWALNRFRDEVREGDRHFCAVEMRWEAGNENECTTCEAALMIDDSEDE